MPHFYRPLKGMNLFFTADIQNGEARLHEEEARHCVQVLRMQPGDPITLVDGKGAWYEGMLTEATKKACRVAIQQQRQLAPPPARVHIGIAPTKSIERFEWFLEKATEIGVDVITPLWCERSERRQIRADRLEKILVAAMKQSLKAILPQLREPVFLKDFIVQNADYQRFIACLNVPAYPHLKQVYQVGEPALVLIGPEGDFSPTEIRHALEQGWQGVSLGASRLRTETAGEVACHILQLLSE